MERNLPEVAADPNRAILFQPFQFFATRFGETPPRIVCNRSKIGTLNGWRPGKVSALPTLNPTPVGAYDGSVRLSSQDSSTRVDVDCARDF